VLRCRPRVGESLIGWRILFVVVPRGYRPETLTDQQAHSGIAEYVLTKVRCQSVITEVSGAPGATLVSRINGSGR
jgi:hypothetical protein